MLGLIHLTRAKNICLLFLVQLCLFFAVAAQETIIRTSQIDSLLEQSNLYMTSGKEEEARRSAITAFDAAKKLDYQRGIASSLLRQAQIAKHFDDDFIQSETLCKKALHSYRQIMGVKELNDLYTYLIYSLLAQSKFEEGTQYAKEKHALATSTGDTLQIIDALSWLQSLYRTSGDYEKSFIHAQQQYKLALNAKSKIWISNCLYEMAQLYEAIEDYPNAIAHFRRVLAMDDTETRNYRLATDNDIWFKMEFTEAFSHLKQFDSAWYYYNLYKPEKHKAVYWRVWWVSTGECYLLQKKYAQALENFRLALPEHLKRNDKNEVMRTLIDIGKTYLGLKKDKEALDYGKQGLNMALVAKSKQFIRDGYQILSSAYDRMHEWDSSNFYFRKYIDMKETVLNDQTKGKFAAYAYEQKLALVNKEKEIQNAKLERESLLRKVLIVGIVALILFGFIVVRHIKLRQKTEKQDLQHKLLFKELEGKRLKAQFHQQAAELKMQALQAQMNPHFIFNSLNSINRFILENNKNEASLYLSKFSKLIRLILYNSQSPYITLESELEALQLYLELETLRFDNRFDYSLQVAPELDVSAVKVPPLIIQPYVENAIWHGLMQKKDKGHLQVELYEENKMLFCRIVDDGIGRAKSAELRSSATSTYKSLGTKITADRISLLQRKSDNEISVTINDLILPDGTAGGTTVLLRIPLLKNV